MSAYKVAVRKDFRDTAELHEYVKDSRNRREGLENDNVAGWYRSDPSRNRWAGGTNEDAERKGVVGSREYGDAVRKALEGMSSLSLAKSAKWERTVAGYIPNVPAYLSGSPENMMRRRTSGSPKPVRMFVSAFVSCGVSNELIAKRGAAVAALAKKLDGVAPLTVTLWSSVLMEGDEYSHRENAVLTTLQVPTRNVDTDMIAWTLCDPAFLRRVFYPAQAEAGAYYSGIRCGETSDWKKALGYDAKRGDIWLGDMHAGTAEFWRDVDPIKWAEDEAHWAVANVR